MDIESIDSHLISTDKESLREKCSKCHDTLAQIKLSSKRLYCRKCFVTNVNRQFQVFVRKNKTTLQQKRVVVAFSGGYSSTTLIHLIYKGVQHFRKVEYPFHPIIIYIDFNHEDTVDSRLYNQPLYDYLSKLGLEYHIYYKSYLKNISIPSQALQHSILLECLKQIAYNLDVEYILTGHNCNHLTSLAFMMMGYGQGKDVMSLIGSEQKLKTDKVTILKPLKNFVAKELIMYNMYNNLVDLSKFDIGNNPLHPSTIDLKEQKSLYLLSNKFLNQLQLSNESTLSTVLRTFNKFKNV